MSTFYNILVHAHSGLRWLVLIAIVVAIIFAAIKWIGKKPFWTTHKKYALIAFILSHLQLGIGLILFFISPKVVFSGEAMKVAMSRFFLAEHTVGMIVGIALITIGYSKAKRAIPEKSAKIIFWNFLLALIVILVSIPWPHKGFGTGWF